MQEIPENKNKRLESRTKHIGGTIKKPEHFTMEPPDLDKKGLSIRDYN